MSILTSRGNPRVRRWRELTRDVRERRSQGRTIIEGENLVSAWLQAGYAVECLILSKTGSQRPVLSSLAQRSGKTPVLLADSLFRQISDVDTPAGIAAEISIPAAAQTWKSAPACVFLDAIQDAGNVGTVLRSAAAFGIRHAVLGQGCADAWSPKVLRAAMGAHFAMTIHENADLVAVVADFDGKVICTVPHGGVNLAEADLSGRVGWLFGSEGQGVSGALASRVAFKVTIPMPGDAESLNVAAAAAICFYELSRRGARA